MSWTWKGLNRFNQVAFLGNEKVVAALSRRVAAGTLGNALLLSGPAGSGKKTLAGTIVQALFCPDSCGKCPSCTMLAHENHPDYLFIAADGQIKLEEAKRLKAFLTTPANTAPKKIAVVENCQNLTVEAGNSLLKILEEPPAVSLCILTTDNIGAVLPTLVSRCQVYSLTALADKTVEEALAQRGVSPAQSWFLANYSQGVLGRALALLEAKDFWLKRKQLAQEIEEIFAGRRNPLLLTDNWQDNPEDSLSLIESWLRDIVLMQLGEEYVPVNNDLSGNLLECAKFCGPRKGIALLEQCFRARDYLHQRCNPRLVLDSLALKMWEV